MELLEQLDNLLLIFPHNKEATVPWITLTCKNTAIYQAADIKIIASMQPNNCKENKAS